MRGPSALELAISSWDGARSAQASFSMPGSKQAGPVLGMIKFEKGCGGDSCASAACCEDSTCVSSCTSSSGQSCKLACFTLNYFDDLQPRLVDSKDLTGPEIGSSTLKLNIAMLPQVDSGEEISVMFDNLYVGTAYVHTSTSEATSLSVLTPPIPLGGLPSKKMPVKLQVLARPDRPLTFEYTALAVSPSLVSLNPPNCFSNAPTTVTMTIEFFPFPGDAVVRFGESHQIGAENITVLSRSNLQKSIITFISPIIPPGLYQVLVFPKSCPKCGKSVTFPYKLRDPHQPELIKPIPTQGKRFPLPDHRDRVRIAKFPATYTDVQIIFVISADETLTASDSSLELQEGVASLAYSRPSISTPGDIQVVIDITTPLEVKSVSFPFTIFDETAVRLVSMSPSAISTRLSLYGRALDLRSTVELIVANFPADTRLDQIKIVLGGGLEANVLSLEDMSRCREMYSDCNRTRIRLLAPAYDVPGQWPAELSVMGATLTEIPLSYFAPCNYQTFCETDGRIVDKYLLETRVPASAACDSQYCLQATSLTDPQIVSFFPTEGPSTGGTIVSVTVNNLPAFSTSDLTIEVGSGASKQALTPEAIAQEPGSTTKSCKGALSCECSCFSCEAVVASDACRCGVSIVMVRVCRRDGGLRARPRTETVFTTFPRRDTCRSNVSESKQNVSESKHTICKVDCNVTFDLKRF